GYRFCDTGLLYRAVTWLALERGVELDDGAALAAMVDEVELALDAHGRIGRVLVGRRDVTREVQSAEIDQRVSEVARAPEVRAALLPRQREIAEGGTIIMAGRDIGTVVLPSADLKIFLDASVEERARRRAEERHLDTDGPEASLILAELRRRDDKDQSRPVAPLRPADDARIIRTDGNRFDDTVSAVVREARPEGELVGST